MLTLFRLLWWTLFISFLFLLVIIYIHDLLFPPSNLSSWFFLLRLDNFLLLFIWIWLDLNVFLVFHVFLFIFLLIRLGWWDVADLSKYWLFLVLYLLCSRFFGGYFLLILINFCFFEHAILHFGGTWNNFLSRCFLNIRLRIDRFRGLLLQQLLSLCFSKNSINRS